MARKVLAAATLAIVAFSGGNAFATHKDPTADPGRCDTWYRDGYDPDNDGNTHEGPGTSTPTIIPVGGPDNTQLLAEGGHYVVQSDSFYLEVVGGQNYARPNNTNGARGGYVQGEVDLGMGLPDVDFLVATFAGTDPNPSLGYTEKDVCVNVADQRVALMDCTKPPKATTPNCH